MPALQKPLLRPNAQVRILCTARKVLRQEIQPAINLLESWGLKVSLGNSIDKSHHQFGGTWKERLADFQQAIDDPKVDAIWIARGGYGSIQLLDHVDVSAFAKAKIKSRKQKLILGYSDVTLLHALWQAQGWPSIHTFMPLELPQKPESSIESLKQVLFAEAPHEISIANTEGLEPLTIEAKVVGGNLSILYSLLGSKEFPPTEDHILFIEEIDEYLYHVERMMYSLKRAGKLQGLTAILVGGLTDMNDHEVPFGKDAKTIIQDMTADYNYPVIFGFPAGHISDHRSIILGHKMEISIGQDLIKILQ